MRELPFDGGTFPDSQISEAGRRLLADLLTQLSRRQIVDLFVSSRFGDLAAVSADARRPEEWASVFERKVQEIASARCPH
jgi:hypothetical protein